MLVGRTRENTKLLKKLNSVITELQLSPPVHDAVLGRAQAEVSSSPSSTWLSGHFLGSPLVTVDVAAWKIIRR